MKRVPLKRGKTLTRTTSLNKVSKKQEIELAKRKLLKYQLFLSQNGKCAQCGKMMTYYNTASDNYPHLSHKKPLSKGGKSDRENLEVLCSQCHSNNEHGRNNKYNEKPRWSKFKDKEE